jgi:hypothetical protein
VVPDSGEEVDVLLNVGLGLVVMDGFVRWVETVDVPNVVREGREVVSIGALVEADDGAEVGVPGLGWVEDREDEIARLLEISDKGRSGEVAEEEMPALGEEDGVGWR